MFENWLKCGVAALLLGCGASAAPAAEVKGDAERYRAAAEAGNAEAQYVLGCRYYCGKGVEKNLERAVQWWRKAAEQGHATAQYDLGLCYANGWGVENNILLALRWYRRAAEQGLKEAQYNLACRYHYIIHCSYSDKDVKDNPDLEFYWFRKSAEQGLKEAQFRLGLCYFLGNGVPKDYEQAEFWFRKAAAQGETLAKALLLRDYSIIHVLSDGLSEPIIR